MYTPSDIIAKAWLVKEVVNLVLNYEGMECHKIFLIGSYASGKADEWSDLDFLVELKGKGNSVSKIYPEWYLIKRIRYHLQDNSSRVHVVFGTEEAQASLYKKGKATAYKEIPIGGLHANSLSPST